MTTLEKSYHLTPWTDGVKEESKEDKEDAANFGRSHERSSTRR